MNREDLRKAIFEVSHITGEFKLRSGKVSHEYFDKYQFEARPELLSAIADHLAAYIPPGTEVLAGLEVGGIPIATALSLKTGIPVCFVRKTAKDYGTCKFAEGVSVTGKKICVIEDVVTSGGQLIFSSRDIKQEGAEILGALCVVDREAGGPESLMEEGIKLKALFTKTELKS